MVETQKHNHASLLMNKLLILNKEMALVLNQTKYSPQNLNDSLSETQPVETKPEAASNDVNTCVAGA